MLKDLLPVLALLKERAHVLTPQQVSALVREFVALENRQKVFVTKLTA